MSENITITLPKELNKKIEKEIKNGKYASKSDFLLFLLRGWGKVRSGHLSATVKKQKKTRMVKLTPDEKIAIERAEDDIRHGRFSTHEKIMKILRSKK